MPHRRGAGLCADVAADRVAPAERLESIQTGAEALILHAEVFDPYAGSEVRKLPERCGRVVGKAFVESKDFFRAFRIEIIYGSLRIA